MFACIHTYVVNGSGGKEDIVKTYVHMLTNVPSTLVKKLRVILFSERGKIVLLMIFFAILIYKLKNFSFDNILKKLILYYM